MSQEETRRKTNIWYPFSISLSPPPSYLSCSVSFILTFHNILFLLSHFFSALYILFIQIWYLVYLASHTHLPCSPFIFRVFLLIDFDNEWFNMSSLTLLIHVTFLFLFISGWRIPFGVVYIGWWNWDLDGRFWLLFFKSAVGCWLGWYLGRVLLFGKSFWVSLSVSYGVSVLVAVSYFGWRLRIQVSFGDFFPMDMVQSRLFERFGLTYSMRCIWEWIITMLEGFQGW